MGRSGAGERRVKRHVVGKEHDFFAVVTPGFEPTARAELAEIGVSGLGEPVRGGVPFRARLDGCYRANLASRTVTRVLLRLASFRATGFAELRRKTENVPWELHVAPGTAVPLRVSASRSRLYHERRIGEEVGAGIAARLGDRPEGEAEQEVRVRLDRDRCTLSLDSTGEPLYRRGRKPLVADAPLRETTAAAILREAGWPGYDVLEDPMCGAGTFPLEAAEMAAGRLPGAGREFAFRRWPAFRPAAFAHLERTLAGAARPREVRILASDRDPAAADVARRNLESAGLDAEVRVADFLDDPERPAPGDGRRRLLVLNPPWGKRLPGMPTERLYRRIGEIVRRDRPDGWAILVPGLELEKAMSLTRDRKILFRSGGLRVAAIVRRG